MKILFVIIVCSAFYFGLCLLKAEAAQERIEGFDPCTIVARDGQSTVIILDAPHPPYSDWSLLVRVGEATFAIPRMELRKLAVSHPEWKRHEE